MFKKLIEYYHTRVTFFDILKGRGLSQKVPGFAKIVKIAKQFGEFCGARHLIPGLLGQPPTYNKNKINLGWCSVFPPTKNGTAAATYYFVKKLLQRDDINLFLIPFEGRYNGKNYPPRLDKRIFSGANIARVDDERLDAVVLFLLGEASPSVVHKIKAPFIVWQTIHYSLRETAERSLFEEIKNYPYKKLYLTGQNAAQDYAACGAREVSYFPLWVDRSLFAPSQEQKKEFTVIFVSRITRHKGVLQFLSSIPVAVKECPKIKFKLHAPFDGMIKIDKETKELIEGIKQLYPDNFSFQLNWTGYEDVRDVYKDASLLVFPSNSEGFGVPLIEAMASGVPSIVLDIPPMNEIIKDNYTGFCLGVDPELENKFKEITEKEKYSYKDYIKWAFPSARQIADKIIYLYKNKKAYDEISRNCVAYSENFDINSLIDKFVKEIKEVVGEVPGFA